MKTTNEKTAEVLNDLIQINNDRVAGYEKAAKETAGDDGDLRNVFNEMAQESRQFVNELRPKVSAKGEEPASNTTARGKIYRAWMDVKATFTGKNRKAILASCEYGEDAAQKAYDTALSSAAELSPEARQVIMDQKTSLKRSHDRIKSLRDSE